MNFIKKLLFRITRTKKVVEISDHLENLNKQRSILSDQQRTFAKQKAEFDRLVAMN